MIIFGIIGIIILVAVVFFLIGSYWSIKPGDFGKSKRESLNYLNPLSSLQSFAKD